MALLAYNLTTSTLVQNGISENELFRLPASGEAGARGAAVNVTSEMAIATSGDFGAVQVAVEACSLEFEWTGPEEFTTFAMTTKPSLIDRETAQGYTTPIIFQASWTAGGPGQRDILVQEVGEGLPGMPYKCKIVDIVM